MRALVVVAAAAVGFSAVAEEKRELDAHEHGHSALNIAIEGDKVEMEFEAPGADIVGFEYAAKTDEDKAAIEAAEKTLADPLALFTPPEAAGCSVTAADAHLVGDEHHEEHADHDDHDHEEHAEAKEAGHDGHAHEKEHDHEHEEHAHEAKHDDHDHEEHAHEAGETHSEFHASYSMTCTNMAALTSLEFGAFETFPNMEEVEVTLISDKGQQSFEVERGETTLDLSGAI